MADKIDQFYNTYGKFSEQALAEIRRETFGEDIGQNSWITTAEYKAFYGWLDLPPAADVLEVASGSGGPALYLARTFDCRVTGIDVNEHGVAAAKQAALAANTTLADFQLADANQPLPFDDETFDAVICTDSINHLQDRPAVLREWWRVLRSGRRILFTDPVVMTGPVSIEELATRSSIGFFLFVPLDVTKRFIAETGFHLLRCDDATNNMEYTSGRWLESRRRHRDDLLQIEGTERFEGLQRFFTAVHTLSSERRLSRFVFVAEKIDI